jgi:CDP-glycerol glycerophosphotransferase (TagB/SpsB family)
MVRVHGKLGEKARSDPGIASFLVPDDVSTNALIARTHTLITDHSSIAFDYLATGSRTLFFTPVAYPRGVYLTDAELPGPRTGSLRELQSWLTGAAPVAGTPPEVARARFCAHEDGHATQRVVGRLLGTTFT